MKNKILYYSLAILLVTIILLCVYFNKHEPVCNRTHIEDITRIVDIVPDEETARKVADVIIDAHAGFNQTLTYDVKITFDEQSNEWEIYYYPMPQGDYYVVDGELIVRIRKDNGLVTEMWLR